MSILFNDLSKSVGWAMPTKIKKWCAKHTLLQLEKYKELSGISVSFDTLN